MKSFTDSFQILPSRAFPSAIAWIPTAGYGTNTWGRGGWAPVGLRQPWSRQRADRMGAGDGEGPSDDAPDRWLRNPGFSTHGYQSYLVRPRARAIGAAPVGPALALREPLPLDAPGRGRSPRYRVSVSVNL
jgi:hypothetical protein